MESFNEFSSRNKYIDETSSVNETIQSNKLTSFKDFQAKQKLEQDKINQYNAASLESYRNSMTQPAQSQNEGTAAANAIANQPTQKLGFGATVGNVLKSAAKSTASSLGNLQGTLFATGQNNRDAMNNEIAQSYQRQASTQQLELDEMLAENRLKPGTYTDEQIALQQDKVNKSNEIANNLGKVNDYQRQAVEANNQFVDELSASAQQDVESAKAGRNAVGRTLVDVGVAGTQLLGDAATNLILPGASLAVMGARSAGGAMQKARQEGASLAKQLGYGAAIGATSILTEKLFDGLAGAFGAGAADDMVEGWVKSIATKWGKGAGDVADIVFGFLGEASEEAIEDVADRIIDKVSKVGVDDKLTLQEVMYDALIGGILGSLGTTTKVVRQNIGANAQQSAQVDVNQENTSLSGEMSQNVENEQEVKPQAETTNQPQATKSYAIEEVNLANGQKGYTVKYTVNDGTNTLYPTGKTYRSKNAAQNYINSISEEITEQDVNIEQKVDETQNPGYNANVNVMKGATDNGGTDLQAEVGREVSEGRASAETDTGIVGERPLVQRNLRNDGVVLLNEQQLEPIKAKGGTPIVMPTTSNDSAYENYLKIAKESDKQNGWAVTQQPRNASDMSMEEFNEYIKGLEEGIEKDRNETIARNKDNDPIIKGDTERRYNIVKHVYKNGDFQSQDMGSLGYEDTLGVLKGYKFDPSIETFGETGFYSKKGTKSFYEVTRELTTEENLQRLQEKDAQEKRVKSVGAANPTQFSKFSNLETKYGVIDGKKDSVRPDDVPKFTDKNKKVSESASTIKGAKVTPDDFVPLFEENVAKGKYSFTPITNNETSKKAQEYITKKGWNGALAEWTSDVRNGKIDETHVIVGQFLYNNAVNSEDFPLATRISVDYVNGLRNAARGLQAARFLQKMTPESRLYMVHENIQNLIENSGLPADSITVSEELQKAYVNAKDEVERDKVLTDITKEVARQMPRATLFEKWTALRYLNMLGNLKTQGRNVLSNAAMLVTSQAKNAVATGMEQVVHLVNKDFERTRAIAPGKERLNTAWNDFKKVEKLAMGETKYSPNEYKVDKSEFARNVEKEKKIFDFVPLEAARKATNWAMEMGDVIFSRTSYTTALAGYMKAHNVTAEQWNDAKWQKNNSDFVDKARKTAIKEAQEATFRDTNALSGWLSRLARENSAPWYAKILAEGFMPFRKTPANIFVRAFEYSPIGYLKAAMMGVEKGLGLDTKKGKNGKPRAEITGADIINQLAKSTTGSVIFGIGMMLKAAGKLRGGDDEDENQQRFDEMQGHQNYSVEIDGKSYTIDWMTPGSMPLFLGATFYDLWKKDGLDIGDFVKASSKLIDPLVQMSLMSGVDDTLNVIKYSGDNNILSILEYVTLSYLTQGLTNTALGQLERTFEDVRMSTYVDKNKDLSSIFQKSLGKASAKTPIFDYNQYPYINPWGEEEKTGDVGQRILTNFLSPGYYSEITSSATEEELKRLVEKTKDTNLYPKFADKSFAVSKYDKDGKTISSETKQLTKDEYVKYAKAKGQESAKTLEKIFKNNTYKKLTDEQKAKAVQMAYEYANAEAKSKVSDYVVGKSSWINGFKESDYEISEYITLYLKYGGGKYLSGEDYEKMKKAEKAGLSNEEYIKLRKNASTDDVSGINQDEAEYYLNNKTSLSNSQKAELWNIINSSWKTNPYDSSSNTKSKSSTKSSSKASDFWLNKLK